MVNNHLLHSLKGLSQIWFAPGTTPQYYPLSLTSFWVDYHLWKLNPLGYHLTNILFQALNAILLWTLLRRLSVPGAWLAAAIFAIHPVNVESVAWDQPPLSGAQRHPVVDPAAPAVRAGRLAGGGHFRDPSGECRIGGLSPNARTCWPDFFT